MRNCYSLFQGFALILESGRSYNILAFQRQGISVEKDLQTQGNTQKIVNFFWIKDKERNRMASVLDYYTTLLTENNLSVSST